MKLIKPEVLLINEKDPFKKMELAGRTCYKSEAKITETSAKKFCGMLIKNNHLAMAEHAVFCFYNVVNKTYAYNLETKYKQYNDSHVTVVELGNGYYRIIFTANLRVLIENSLITFDADWNIIDLAPTSDLTLCDFEEDIKCKRQEEILQHRYTTMRFITDRGVTHELVRHRKCSFAQESTRYVKYNQGNMQFIEPTNYENWTPELQGYFLSACSTAENCYCKMMEHGAIAQTARAVLPNAIKTEIVVTTYDEEWKHIYELRCSKAAHPDIKNIMDISKSMYLQTYGEDALFPAMYSCMGRVF